MASVKRSMPFPSAPPGAGPAGFPAASTAGSAAGVGFGVLASSIGPLLQLRADPPPP